MSQNSLLTTVTARSYQSSLDDYFTDRSALKGIKFSSVDHSCSIISASRRASSANKRSRRTLGRPFFVDKMPNNDAHVPLIHLILPNAKIIDARRHPMGSCFSNFKQHFARGQHFTYALTDVGRYYHDYVELMAHYDTVLPGKVHRVIYEQLVCDPEKEIRGILEYLGLPFEERCLCFHETERSVRTASSEQVRMSLYKGGVDHWKNFEPWLGPLKTALGAVLEKYPGVPEF
jgi:hypothetical protein